MNHDDHAPALSALSTALAVEATDLAVFLSSAPELDDETASRALDVLGECRSRLEGLAREIAEAGPAGRAEPAASH